MSHTGVNIGMMDSAYFVGRKEILEWLNDLLHLDLAKIEETASGAIACQLMDIIHPGKVPMHKVKWNAKVDYEFVHNYKILQSVFNRLKIDKHIDVDKLIRAKYQDNLEFMQWMKRFYDLNCPEGADYDPVAQRQKGKGTFTTPANVTRKRVPAGGKPRAAPSAGSSAPSASEAGEKENRALNRGGAGAGGSSAAARPAPARRGGAADPEVTRKLKKRLAEMKLIVEGLEKERDFYFGKLRDIEVLLQVDEATDAPTLKEKVFKILYAAEEDFVAAEEEEAAEAGDAAPSAQAEEAGAEGEEQQEGGAEAPSEDEAGGAVVGAQEQVAAC